MCGSVSQVLNAFSRMGASVLTWIPPARAGHFSDQVQYNLHTVVLCQHVAPV